MRICLYGPSGSGKSTLASYICSNWGGQIVKLSAPLHEAQREFSRVLGLDLRGQDGELLQYLGERVEREKPGHLAEIFRSKVFSSASGLVVNDDCRSINYAALRSIGFIFIKVVTSGDVRESRRRADHTPHRGESFLEKGFELFEHDYVVENSGSIEDSYSQLDVIVRGLREGHGWLTGTEIGRQVEGGKIIIDPFDRAQINSNSYNYRLSSSAKRLVSRQVCMRTEEEWEDFLIPEHGATLLPGECYLGSTVERFGSDFFASLITGRSSVGRKFVTNHVTAGLIDQGFVGNITLEITVQRPTTVYAGMPFGQIFWFTVSGEPLRYSGKYQGQTGAWPSRIHLD